jgi:hypothetical protein
MVTVLEILEKIMMLPDSLIKLNLNKVLTLLVSRVSDSPLLVKKQFM